MLHSKGIVIMVICWLVISRVQAQIEPAFVQQSLEKELARNAAKFKYPGRLKEFYKSNRYTVAWMNHEAARRQLLMYLDSALQVGLRKEDYQWSFINSFRANSLPLRTAGDSLAAEFRFTDAAIHFFHDVVMGNAAPAISYNGLNYHPACINIETLLSVALQGNRLDSFLYHIELRLPEYLAVKHKLNQFLKVVADTAAKGKERIKSGAISDGNRPLIQKLFQYQVLDSPVKKIPANDLKEKIKEAQRLFSLTEEGVIRTALVKELDVPLAVRIEELSRALNTIRWLHCIRQQHQHIIVVNIPSANLLLYGRESVTMESRVVVGKRSTRTPTLCSRVTDVILYPYWMVPKKIATRELLPLIKKNISFLDANKIQVVNEQGRVVSPSTINWNALSVDYFPYTLRQSTGCDNSLGIVKLNFYSPYGVFLHDTPWKSFFSLNRRFYSHGCIRVEKAIELAHLVLKDNTIAIDTLEEKGCLRNQKPLPVAASEKMPVFVLYNTAWVDSSATVRFYGDIYSKRTMPKQ